MGWVDRERGEAAGALLIEAIPLPVEELRGEIGAWLTVGCEDEIGSAVDATGGAYDCVRLFGSGGCDPGRSWL